MKRELKQPLISIRHRLPNGGIERKSEAVVQHAPLRAATYSVGERVTIVELMIFFLVDREVVTDQDINHLVISNLKLQKCENLLRLGSTSPRFGRTAPGLQITDVWRQLIDLKLLNSPTRRTGFQAKRTGFQVAVTITPKGKRHIKKQPKRLQLCAQKLVYTDLLEKLGRSVS